MWPKNNTSQTCQRKLTKNEKTVLCFLVVKYLFIYLFWKIGRVRIKKIKIVLCCLKSSKRHPGQDKKVWIPSSILRPHEQCQLCCVFLDVIILFYSLQWGLYECSDDLCLMPVPPIQVCSAGVRVTFVPERLLLQSDLKWGGEHLAGTGEATHWTYHLLFNRTLLWR